jgi:hypothetical protein
MGTVEVTPNKGADMPETPAPVPPQKLGWLSDLKDSDKVALAILLLGVLITTCATGAHLWLTVHVHGIAEPDMDRSVSAIKDFFEVGTGLIGASLLALKLQPKNGVPPK